MREVLFILGPSGLFRNRVEHFGFRVVDLVGAEEVDVCLKVGFSSRCLSFLWIFGHNKIIKIGNYHLHHLIYVLSRCLRIDI